MQRIFAAGATVAMLCLATPSGAADTVLKAAATACMTERDAKETISACTAVIAAGEKSGVLPYQALVHRGLAHAGMNEFDLAIADYNKAIHIDAKSADAYYGRALAYYRTGNLTKAIADYTTVLGILPTFAEGYDQRGNAYDDLGQREKAVADYDKAIALDPKFAMAYFDRGLSQLRATNADGAISDFDRAIALDPLNARIYLQRGRAYHLKGAYPSALASFDRALTLDPTMAEVHFWRGSARDMSGDYDGALADYDAFIAAAPNAALAYLRRAGTYTKKLMLDAALADARRALKLDPRLDAARQVASELEKMRAARDAPLKQPGKMLARSYLDEAATIDTIEQVGGVGAKLTLMNPTTGAKEEVTDPKASIAMHKDQLARYADELRRRGSPAVAGSYAVSAGTTCKGEKLDPRALLASGGNDQHPVLTPELTITQQGFETTMAFDAVVDGKTRRVTFDGVAVEDDVVFASALGFRYWGTLRGTTITLRFDIEEMKAAIGPREDWADDWKAIDACAFRLKRK